jgi:hypothetical protein
MTDVALSAEALRDVVNAASRGATVVVPHDLRRDVLSDDSELSRLAASLPKGWIRGVDGTCDPTSGRQPAELGVVLPYERDEATVTRLYHLQHAPEFRELTNSVYDPLEQQWPRHEEPWLERDAGIFVTSDTAVTPAHADRHHNLLLQLSGSKDIAVCVPGSRAHADAVARSLPSLHVDEMPEGTEVVALEPGSALYMPPYTLHWVRSKGRSVALSCGWSSAATVRAGQVHAANARLRRLRVPAQPVGCRTDGVKLRAVAAAQGLRSAARRG